MDSSLEDMSHECNLAYVKILLAYDAMRRLHWWQFAKYRRLRKDFKDACRRHEALSNQLIARLGDQIEETICKSL